MRDSSFERLRKDEWPIWAKKILRALVKLPEKGLLISSSPQKKYQLKVDINDLKYLSAAIENLSHIMGLKK